jgi:hypothetical protein
MRQLVMWALLAVAGLVTLLGVVLVIAAVNEDSAIRAHTGRAVARVISVSFQRTLVSYQTPDGAEHIPNVGVLYPEALQEGQFVQVEYDQTDPELVRVAGRGASLTVLPVSTTVVLTWLVLAPSAWWVRRRM